MTKILIIEDDQVLRNNIATIFMEEGFETFVAIDGAEGIQQAVKHIPDIIICDISMPKMTGYEVIKTLQTLPITAHIPFIFLTAKVQHEDIRLGMSLGADDYIIKPFNIDDLFNSVKLRLRKLKQVHEKTEQNLYALAQSSLVGVFILKENKLLFVNEKFTDITGYTFDIIKDKTLVDWLGTLLEPIETNKIEAWIKGEDSVLHMQIPFLTKSLNDIVIDFLCISFAVIPTSHIVIGNIMNVEKLNQPLTDTEKKKLVARYKITDRELEVLLLLAGGLSSKLIADKLFVGARTIETHRANLMAKTNTQNVAELISFALKVKLI